MAAQAKKLLIAELAGHNAASGHIWVQGCIVSVTADGASTSLLIDDGSRGAGCMRVRVHEKTIAHFGEEGPQAGMYVSVIAAGAPSSEDSFLATKVTNLSQDPNREAIWNTELVLQGKFDARS